MRLLTKLDEIIIELLEVIKMLGKYHDALLISRRGSEQKTIIRYALKAEDAQEARNIDEVYEQLPLIDILIEFISAKKFRDLNRDVGTYAVVLTAARLIKGVTQEKLADDINVSVLSIRYWETGERVPTLENVKRVMAYCDVKFDILLKWIDKSIY